MRSRLVLGIALLVGTTIRPEPACAAPGAAGVVEKEFSAAIKRVMPATVICMGKDAPKGYPGSSGVIVTRDGYVLSDGDSSMVAGLRGEERKWAAEANVLVPDLKSGTTRSYPATVVRRDAVLDTSLLKIKAPPAGGFPFVVPGTADDLRVGSITFVTGNSFGAGLEGTPTLTAGVIAGLVRAPEGAAGGRYLELYSSAAVNPGVNGGPLVDVEGRLVGLVSTWIQPRADDPATLASPYQFLTKAYPVDRLRAFYKDEPSAAVVFPDPKAAPPRSKQATQLESALSEVAKEAGQSVVSLTVQRSEPLKMEIGKPPKVAVVDRYTGPVSGVLLSRDGWVVTSLYNLANISSLSMDVEPKIEDDLKKIVSIELHVGTKTYPARFVADDQRLGIALIKAETGDPETSDLWVAAPAESFQVGRMVLCLGNPYGASSNPDPLVTFGIVSRVHPATSGEAWRGNVQTDAGGTDANCGGALVDLRGRLIGLATIWTPFMHGRNSGISFGVPWDRVRASLPTMKAGRSVRTGYLGIEFEEGAAEARIKVVAAGGGGEKAGLLAGDTIVSIDGKPVKTILEAIQKIREHILGDTVRIRVQREGKPVDVEATLGERMPS